MRPGTVWKWPSLSTLRKICDHRENNALQNSTQRIKTREWRPENQCFRPACHSWLPQDFQTSFASMSTWKLNHPSYFSPYCVFLLPVRPPGWDHSTGHMPRFGEQICPGMTSLISWCCLPEVFCGKGCNTCTHYDGLVMSALDIGLKSSEVHKSICSLRFEVTWQCVLVITGGCVRIY